MSGKISPSVLASSKINIRALKSAPLSSSEEYPAPVAPFALIRKFNESYGRVFQGEVEYRFVVDIATLWPGQAQSSSFCSQMLRKRTGLPWSCSDSGPASACFW